MEFTQATTDLVNAVAACLPAEDWQPAFLDFELREVPDGFDSDYVGIVLLKDATGDLVQDQFQLDTVARQAAGTLYLQRKMKAEEANSGFVLRLEQSGTYRIDFKNRVKRMDGIWDAAEEGYADNYLSHYLREQAEG